MVSVYSEIGMLKKVLVHRPGNELGELHPRHLQEMLFEDTPYLPAAQAEHDAFTGILRDEGVEVLDIRDLFEGAMGIAEARESFTREFVAASCIPSAALAEAVADWYAGLSVEAFAEAVFCGIRRDAEPFASDVSLGGLTYKDDIFLVNPLPNAYFARDSSITVGDAVVLSHMSMEARRREPLLLKYIHAYAPEFADKPTEDLYDLAAPYGIEGGDFLILSPRCCFIGCSERTQPGAIEAIAPKLFLHGFESVYAIELPRGREAMHLDGMLTMVAPDTFMYNPFMSGAVNVFRLRAGAAGVDGLPTLVCEQADSNWGRALAEGLGLSSVRLIPCGGGDAVRGMWELWNLGSNVLTVRPGLAVGYDRNPASLELMDKAGISVRTFSGSELSRGRGGARCMSMPLVREAL